MNGDRCLFYLTRTQNDPKPQKIYFNPSNVKCNEHRGLMNTKAFDPEQSRSLCSCMNKISPKMKHMVAAIGMTAQISPMEGL